MTPQPPPVPPDPAILRALPWWRSKSFATFIGGTLLAVGGGLEIYSHTHDLGGALLAFGIAECAFLGNMFTRQSQVQATAVQTTELKQSLGDGPPDDIPPKPTNGGLTND